jgi:phosphatidylserine/phosphatidylglycerophosphate/cardiolipin synthase-like enzyme
VIEQFVALPLSELERLLDAARTGEITPPVEDPQLMAERLNLSLPFVSLLQRFPTKDALVLFLESVVLQRREQLSAPRPELVWTGPEPAHSRARKTGVVVRELFEKARHEVFIAGYSFHGGEELLEPLHAVMRDHGVRTRIVLDGSQWHVYEDTPPDRVLAGVVRHFWTKVWVHGDPRPELFHDPRTLLRKPPLYGGAAWFPEASMHAKCIVVDGREALVGSANFTDRAQTRNVEVGVAVREEWFARALLHQWNAAMGAGMVVNAEAAAEQD